MTARWGNGRSWKGRAGRAPVALGMCAVAFVALVAATCDGQSLTDVEPTLGVRTELPPLVPGTLAIVGVSLVDMESPTVLADHTVIVQDGIISEIGPADAVDVPADADRIEGDGRFLMPGLIDMHVHARASEMAAYRSAGITTVRNMWGTAGVALLRRDLEDGADHPAILSAAPGMDGDPPIWPGSTVLTGPDAARAAVRRDAAAGWDFIKVYNRLRPEVYDAILAEAADVGIGVIGHVPLAVSIDRASAAGHASVAHLTGIAEAVADGRGPSGWLRYDVDSAARVAGVLARRGTWVCPTLVVLRHLADRNLSPDDAARAVAHQAAVVKALHDAGVPILAGTDSGIDAVPAGSSLWDELDLLMAAGLPPYDALRAATVDAARFLELDDRLGTITVGKRADLLLLARNPLDDITAVREPVALVQRGRRLY